MHEVYSAAVNTIHVVVRGYLCVSMHKFCFNSHCIQQILSVCMLDKHKHALPIHSLLCWPCVSVVTCCFQMPQLRVFRILDYTSPTATSYKHLTVV